MKQINHKIIKICSYEQCGYYDYYSDGLWEWHRCKACDIDLLDEDITVVEILEKIGESHECFLKSSLKHDERKDDDLMVELFIGHETEQYYLVRYYSISKWVKKKKIVAYLDKGKTVVRIPRKLALELKIIENI